MKKYEEIKKETLEGIREENIRRTVMNEVRLAVLDLDPELAEKDIEETQTAIKSMQEEREVIEGLLNEKGK